LAEQLAQPIGLVHIVLKRFPTLRMQFCKFVRIHFVLFTVYVEDLIGETYFQLLRRFHPQVLNETLRAAVRTFIKRTNLDTHEQKPPG
jgi:hypothetical protein